MAVSCMLKGRSRTPAPFLAVHVLGPIARLSLQICLASLDQHLACKTEAPQAPSPHTSGSGAGHCMWSPSCMLECSAGSAVPTA